MSKNKEINKRYKSYFIIIVIIILFIASINIVNNKISSKQDLLKSNAEVRDENEDRSIVNNITISDDNETSELYNIVNTYIENYSFEYDDEYINRIGIVYYDLNTAQSIEINADKQFVGASTYKVMINIAAYSEVLKGNVSLNDKIYYDEIDFEDGESIIDTESTEPYTLQELLDSSIINSDNISSHMVYRHLGGRENTMRIAGEVLGIDINTEENYESANNLRVALEYIYNNRGNQYYNHLLNTMTKTIYNDRLDKYLPREIVAHKVGMYEEYVHDVGIILTEEPYILSVFTEDVIDGYEFIAGLSKVIYDYKLGIE